jgi:hypothetical protein
MDNWINMLSDSGIRTSVGEIIFNCRCKCGTEFKTVKGRIKSGHTKSCGCLRRITQPNYKHGHKRAGCKSPEYTSWMCMKDRCFNVKHDRYKWYGAKGVTVCDQWKHSFETFLHDMGERIEGYTLDRINPYGNYSPENCRWATAKEQSHNKRHI